VNTQVRVVFSGPIDPTTVSGPTIQLSGGGQTAVPQAISFSNANQTVMITPQGVLPANTVMTLTLAGVTDGAGNPVPPVTTHFTTSGAVATVTPVILTTNPPDNTTNIPVNAVLAVQTNAVLDLSTVTSATFRVHDSVTGQDAVGTYALSADGMTVYFVPSALATGRTYTVYVNSSTVGLTDVIGNLVPGDTFSFTTGVGPSTVGPQVSAVSPANGLTQAPTNARVTIQFNEPIDIQTIGQVMLTAIDGPVSVIRAVTNGNQTIVLVPVIALRPNTVYTVSISNVADLSGLVTMAPVTTSFTTGTTVDFSSPQVNAVSPANGAASVQANATVQVQFSKTMNPLTISISTFNVSVNGGNPIPGTIVVSPDKRSATFTPSNNLAPGSTYIVRLNSAITDLSGLALTSFQSSFATQ
jgi:hypothetical protein